MSKLRIENAMLVYQAGIANVFQVERLIPTPKGRNAKRLIQSDFRTCESFARGLAVAGVYVDTMACNRASDIVDAEWSQDLDEQPFSDKFHPVVSFIGGKS